MTPRPTKLLASLALAWSVSVAGCAAERPRFEDVAPPEGFVEVLPRGAALAIDGVDAGTGARALPVRDPAQVVRIRATAPGFEPAELAITGEKLTGARVALVLRPLGFGAARTLDLDEPAGLTSAAALLLRGGYPVEATDYAARAVELAPDAPAPHRVLGDAWARLGRRDRAIPEYLAYLAAAPPDAPERADVERRLGAIRGDVELGGAR
jgi:hypothetical protein